MSWLLAIVLALALPTVGDVAQYRRTVLKHLVRLENETSVEAQKDLRSQFRNIVGNGRKQWKALHVLDERIARRMPVVPACLDRPVCTPSDPSAYKP